MLLNTSHYLRNPYISSEPRLIDFLNELLLVVQFNVRFAIILQIVVLFNHPSLPSCSVCFLCDFIIYTTNVRLEVLAQSFLLKDSTTLLTIVPTPHAFIQDPSLPFALVQIYTYVVRCFVFAIVKVLQQIIQRLVCLLLKQQQCSFLKPTSVIYPPTKDVCLAIQYSFSIVSLEVELYKGITLICLPSAKILLPYEVLEVLVVYIHLNQFLATAKVQPLFLKRYNDGYQLLVIDYVLPLYIIELFREERNKLKLAIRVPLSKYSLYYIV